MDRGGKCERDHRLSVASGYKQSIESSKKQPGILATRHSCLYIRLSSIRRFFISSAPFSRLLGEILDEEPSQERRRPVYAHVHYRVPPSCSPSLALFLPLFLVLFRSLLSLVPPSRHVLLRLATLRRIHTVEGLSRTKTAAQTYVIAGVSASFLLCFSSSLSLSRSDFATLRRVPAGRTARGEEREGGHAHVDYRISLPPRLRSSSLRSRSLRFYNARSLSCHLEKDIHIPNRIRGISNRGTVKSSPECTR